MCVIKTTLIKTTQHVYLVYVLHTYNDYPLVIVLHTHNNHPWIIKKCPQYSKVFSKTRGKKLNKYTCLFQSWIQLINKQQHNWIKWVTCTFANVVLNFEFLLLTLCALSVYNKLNVYNALTWIFDVTFLLA